MLLDLITERDTLRDECNRLRLELGSIQCSVEEVVSHNDDLLEKVEDYKRIMGEATTKLIIQEGLLDAIPNKGVDIAFAAYLMGAARVERLVSEYAGMEVADAILDRIMDDLGASWKSGDQDKIQGAFVDLINGAFKKPKGEP